MPSSKRVQLLGPLLVGLVLINSVSSGPYKSVYELLTDFRDLTANNKSSVRSATCENQLDAYFDGLANRDEWAWNMLDATGKIAPAILRGNPDDPGYYDQCIDINEEVNGEILKGNYCYFGLIIPWALLIDAITASEAQTTALAEVKPRFVDFPRLNSRQLKQQTARNQIVPDPIEYYGIALCIPDACLPSDIVGELGRDDYCGTKGEHQNLDASDIACIAFLATIVAFMIVSTVYDLYLQEHGQKAIHPIFVAFSVYSNGKKILTVSKPGTSGQILCFQGMKSISLFWVIAGHSMSGKQSFGAMNIFDTYKWMRNWYAVYILQAPLAVDTFLFLSGVLLSYNFIKSMSKPKARFNVLLYYLHRYLRLTPAFAAVYFVTITVLRKAGTGPVWAVAFEDMRRACLDHWWAVFLYVQNYVATDDMCLVPTWYLSVDMQFFIVSPLILLPLLKWRRYTLRFGLPLAIFGAILCPFLIIYLNDVAFWDDDYYNMYYYVTHTRFGPWLVGIAFGVYMLKVQDREFKINPFLNVFFWVLDFGVMAAIFFTQDHLAYNPEKLKSAFYLSLIRPGWAVCLCWVVFACVKGYGGFINTFLSLPVFQVVAKLSYSVYLVHFSYIVAVQSHRRTKTYYNDFENLNEIASNIVFSLIIGTFWTLAFESPMITIERIIFGGGPRKPKKAVTNETHPTSVKIDEDNTRIEDKTRL